ncbi:AAA family ATPase [Mediterranea massiliensis]|uniref:AAA family ATPase n=1 Tax=Mediterranea massiliensis TaxID=1841865 RepID=UPI0025A38046|nr:AAA family ATPase [Mediterranea massiliensis]MDM8338405.1 AAA family ATPase [Mediterranea massiliensis]
MNEINLQNFRCYSDLTITFKSGINLLIGDNATGKTSVLLACKYVLSAFFSGFSDENTKWISPHNDDFRIRSSQGILLPELPIYIQFQTSDIIEYPDILQQTSLFDPSTSYTLTKNSKKNSRALTTGIREYKNYAAWLMAGCFTESGQQMALPLFASFSTEDIHANRKIDASRFKIYNHKASFGYYECLEGNGFFPYWLKRLLVLQESRENHPEIIIVRTAIRNALGPEGCNIISDMQVRPNQRKVYYILPDGRETEANYLSDGYRRLVNIVTDLAFRCALLNRGIYGENACALTRGTVLIDEADLHLHPSLQAVVLKGLRHAFPRLQFIVSSHAPMLMSCVETNDENIVYKLNYSSADGYGIIPVNTYGMDLSTLTDVILDQVPRATAVDQNLSHLFRLIDEGDYKEAAELLQQLRDCHGENLPELTQAEAMLNCVIPE